MCIYMYMYMYIYAYIPHLVMFPEYNTCIANASASVEVSIRHAH